MQPPKSLKIALLYDDSLDGSEGVTQYVKNLGEWLEGRDHSVSYFVGETKLKKWANGNIYSLSRNLKVIFNGNRNFIPLPGSKKAIRKALRAENPDILHVQMPHSPFMAQRVINCAARPTVGTFHIYPSNWVVTIGTKLLRLAYLGGLRKIGEVVSVSGAAQSFAQQSFKLNTQVIPNLVKMSQFKQVNRKNKPFTAVFIGRLVPRKGVAQLLNAFSMVVKDMPEANLLIGGDGPQRKQLEQQVKNLGIQKNVKFLGYINEENKANLLGSATVACFPSLYGESFGIVLIEAMAAGAGVVIGGDNPGYKSVLGAKPELLFDPKNSMEFATKLKEFLRETPKNTELHHWQKNEVKKYDINTVGQQIEQLYFQAIAKDGATGHN